MCTMMVVEDGSEVRRVVRDGAAQRGHQVLEAGTEKEALDVAKSKDPDVIIVNTRLDQDHSDGFDVLQRLRRAGLNSFAVIVNGRRNGRTRDFARWKELRIFDVVDKPFQIKNLIDKLEAAADATRHEGRLCKFLDNIISRNELSLSAGLSGGCSYE